MGNRAVITTKEKEIGIYVHWFGGRPMIEGFLAACKELGFRPPEDDDYGWARLCQVITNYDGKSGLSVGINLYGNLDTDNGDNGVYVIKDWEIVGREFMVGEDEINQIATEKVKNKCLEIMNKLGG